MTMLLPANLGLVYRFTRRVMAIDRAPRKVKPWPQPDHQMAATPYPGLPCTAQLLAKAVEAVGPVCPYRKKSPAHQYLLDGQTKQTLSHLGKEASSELVVGRPGASNKTQAAR